MEVNNIYRKLVLLISGIVFLGLYSCETIVDIALPVHNPNIVINSVISDQDSIVVNISGSLGILDNSNINLIENAQVLLYANGQFADTLKFRYGNYYSTHMPQIGVDYLLKVNSGKMPEATVSTIVPFPVPINYMTIKDSVLITQENSDAQITFNLSDPAGVSNYYKIELLAILDSLTVDSFGFNSCLYSNTIKITSEDPIFDKGDWSEDGLSFTDELFNGQTKQITINFSSYYWNCPELKAVKLVLFSISRDYYLYLKSSQMQMNTNGNPFAEPVPVYNNVTNGFGIFGSYSSSNNTILK